MKIGIMGTHGTGKTTLALRLAGTTKEKAPGERVGVLTEIARTCPFKLNEQVTPEAQAWIFHQQIVREIEEAAHNEVVVCDRTILDSLAYSRAAGFLGQVSVLMPQAREWLSTYETLYWCRPNGHIAPDGFRSTDPTFQRRIDRILAEWVDTFNLSIIEVKSCH